MAPHADPDNRHLDHVRVRHQVAIADLLAGTLQRPHGTLQVVLGHGEGEIGGLAVLGDVLHDHVDIDAGLGQRPEDRRRHARPVGHPKESNLGLVPAVRDAAYQYLLHDLVLIDHEGALSVAEARQHLHRHPVLHSHLDGAGLQHPGAQRGHLQHLLVGDPIKFPRSRHDPRIGRVDAVHVGIDIAAFGRQRRGQRHRGGIGAAPAQGGHPVARRDALKSGHHRDLPLAEAALDLAHIEAPNAGRAVDVVALDRQLPAEPRTRRYADVLQGHGEEAGGDLLAGRDHHVVLAQVLQGRGLARPVVEPVGGVGHRRDHDRDLVAGLDGRLDPPGHAPDAVHVGDRGAAKLHHYPRHVF